MRSFWWFQKLRENTRNVDPNSFQYTLHTFRSEHIKNFIGFVHLKNKIGELFVEWSGQILRHAAKQKFNNKKGSQGKVSSADSCKYVCTRFGYENGESND